MRYELTDKLVHQYAVVTKLYLKKQGFDIPDDVDDKEVLLRHFNLEKRLIKPQPRKIHQSKELICPENLAESFEQLKRAIESGRNINGYQTTKVSRADKHDYLLYDWGIHHFHFDDFTTGKVSKKKRSKELLFAFFTEQDAYLIDVKGHGSFSDSDLLEIIDSNWSELLSIFQVEGRLANSISDEDRSDLRKACINSPTALKSGKVLLSSMIGGGIVASGDSAAASERLNHLYHTFDDILDYIEAVKSNKEIDSLIQFQTEVRLGVDEFARLYICDEKSTCIIPMEYLENKAKKYADKKFQSFINKHIQSRK